MTEGEQPKIDRSGIYIERDLATAVDIEEELDSAVLGPFKFPSPLRRRSAGWIYLAGAAVVTLTVDQGWIPALGFLALAGWHIASAWPLNLDEHDALHIAAGSVEFPIGHASAAVTFRGWRSRPRWAVLLYSATEPPDARGLVVVDAVDGGVVEDVYTEDVPNV
ncbi:MAG TPA: hypothetical protein VIW94_05265 [Acidimicrobiia bacterium]